MQTWCWVYVSFAVVLFYLMEDLHTACRSTQPTCLCVVVFFPIKNTIVFVTDNKSLSCACELWNCILTFRFQIKKKKRKKNAFLNSSLQNLTLYVKLSSYYLICKCHLEILISDKSICKQHIVNERVVNESCFKSFNMFLCFFVFFFLLYSDSNQQAFHMFL